MNLDAALIKATEIIKCAVIAATGEQEINGDASFVNIYRNQDTAQLQIMGRIPGEHGDASAYVDQANNRLATVKTLLDDAGIISKLTTISGYAQNALEIDLAQPELDQKLGALTAKAYETAHARITMDIKAVIAQGAEGNAYDPDAARLLLTKLGQSLGNIGKTVGAKPRVTAKIPGSEGEGQGFQSAI